MTKLSNTQQRALEQLQREGHLFAGNGISIRTVRALEAAGLARVEAKLTKRQYRTSEYRRDKWDLDWSAKPVNTENN